MRSPECHCFSHVITSPTLGVTPDLSVQSFYLN